MQSGVYGHLAATLGKRLGYLCTYTESTTALLGVASDAYSLHGKCTPAP